MTDLKIVNDFVDGRHIKFEAEGDYQQTTLPEGVAPAAYRIIDESSDSDERRVSEWTRQIDASLATGGFPINAISFSPALLASVEANKLKE